MPDIYPGKDSYMRMDNESTWAGARDASSAETVNASATNGQIKISANGAGSQFDVYRIFMAFDTSAIGVAPSSANLVIRGYSAGTADLIVVKVASGATGDPTTNFDASDFSKIDGFVSGSSMSGNATDYSSEITTWSTSGQNTITLNAAALADIASLSDFKLCLVSYDYDYLNTAISNGSTVRSGMGLVSSSTASYRPYLSYTEAGPSGIDKVNDISKSSILSIDSISRSSIAALDDVT